MYRIVTTSRCPTSILFQPSPAVPARHSRHTCNRVQPTMSTHNIDAQTTNDSGTTQTKSAEMLFVHHECRFIKLISWQRCVRPVADIDGDAHHAC